MGITPVILRHRGGRGRRGNGGGDEQCQQQIPAENSLPDIYALCGTGTDGKLLAMVTHYTDDDHAPSREITLDFGRKGNYQIYLLDESHDGELVNTTETLTFDLPVHSAILIQEI